MRVFRVLDGEKPRFSGLKALLASLCGHLARKIRSNCDGNEARGIALLDLRRPDI
jgi:hypothetical protein